MGKRLGDIFILLIAKLKNLRVKKCEKLQFFDPKILARGHLRPDTCAQTFAHGFFALKTFAPWTFAPRHLRPHTFAPGHLRSCTFAPKFFY